MKPKKQKPRRASVRSTKGKNRKLREREKTRRPIAKARVYHSASP